MIVTIDDYRGAADSNAGSKAGRENKDDDLKFTVAKAGHLKMKLQTLNSMLTRIPFDQHGELLFDVILQSLPPRTYVNGSEEVYFLVKKLPRPDSIPKVFVNAYREVSQSRPFTNRYIRTDLTLEELKYYGLQDPVFAPTFSSVRRLLPELDALCNTSLSDIFRNADDRLRSFPFMRLPAELRLQVYDCLVHNKPFVHMRTCKVYENLPVHLDIMRVTRALHKETTRHFFNKPTLFIEACEEPRRPQDQAAFTKSTAEQYATLITSFSTAVRCNFTRFEIRILSGVPDLGQDTEHEKVQSSPLRRICAALPNLAVVHISFQRIEEWCMGNPGLPPRIFRGNHHNSLTRTLDWIYAQLPVEQLQITWDLTHYRGRVDSAEQLMDIVRSERVMSELIERDGSLKLEQSVTATWQDSQKWSGMPKRSFQTL